MTTSTIIIWILLAISFLLIVFANKIADIYVRYKINKNNNKSNSESTKVETEEESIYDMEFDSTNEYDKVVIMDKLRDSIKYISNVGHHTATIEFDINKLLELYSNIERVEEKHKLNDINRSILYYFISFNKFKDIYTLNKSLDMLTNDFMNESIDKLGENVKHTIELMNETYVEIVDKQNEIFIRTTDARNKTLKSIKSKKNI